MSATDATNARMQSALDLVDQIVPVFPCNTDKEPLTPHGYKDASIDTVDVLNWWTQWPGALIGTPTGPAGSGYDVLDIDPRNGGDAWLRENGKRLPATRTHKTRSGGLHLLFKSQPGLRCSTGNPAPGVDIRAAGGYVIRWDAHGYEVARDEPVAGWPEWLLREIATKQPAAKEGGVALADRLPPSGDAVVTLLDRMPNPLHADRSVYTTVMPAAQGCIDALDEAGTLGDDDKSRIGDAAVAWAERWEGRRDNETDEREKWERDWSTRNAPLAGWQALEKVACALIPGYRLEQAQAEFTAVPPLPDTRHDDLLRALCVHTWATLEIPPEDRLLGDLVTASSRVFIVGSTGLGKTQIAHAMAAGIATGSGFLHWKCDHPARCLVIDGEMSQALLKDRTAAVIQRSAHEIPPGSLVIYGLDRSEAFAQQFPGLGHFEPLNTAAGHAFVKRLIGIVKPDAIFFDNVMSLVAGDQKDEIPWSETLPLVGWITAQGIGQVWLDHTGHDRTRQYGSSTKAWRFDAVGIMTAAEGEDKPGEISFTLSFDGAGKARRRTPANWRDFADHTITLADNTWSATPVSKGKPTATAGAIKVKPAAVAWYGALVEALRATPTPGTVTKKVWFALGVRRSLTEAIAEDDTRSVKEAKRGGFRNALSGLVAAGWIAIDGEIVRDLRDGGAIADLI